MLKNYVIHWIEDWDFEVYEYILVCAESAEDAEKMIKMGGSIIFWTHTIEELQPLVDRWESSTAAGEEFMQTSFAEQIRAYAEAHSPTVPMVHWQSRIEF